MERKEVKVGAQTIEAENLEETYVLFIIWSVNMDLHLKKTGGKKPSEGEGQETKKPKPCVNSLHDNDITRNGHRINRGATE